MAVKSLEDLFLDELKDVYHAEKQLVRALPKMAKAASNPDLKQAITDHLEETKGQVERLEKVFESIDQKPKTKPCEAMKGLIEEGEDMMEEIEDESVLDVGLIMGGQKIEHYEIATYGALAALAERLGYDEARQLLEETLEEEKGADQKLNDIALSQVNAEAEGEDAEGEDDGETEAQGETDGEDDEEARASRRAPSKGKAKPAKKAA